MDFIFTRKKLHLLEDYIYYNLELCLSWIYEIVLLQIVYFQKALNVSEMEYFMYPSMLHQFNVYNMVQEPGRMYLSGTLELPTFINKLLIFMWHTLAYKKSSRKF